MKSIIQVIAPACILIYMYLADPSTAGSQHTASASIHSAIKIEAPAHIIEILGPGNNYISGTLNTKDIRWLAKVGVDTIFRFNGNGKDTGELSVSLEHKLARMAGIGFEYINLDGNQTAQQLEYLHQALSRGNKAIHCLHGAHRAPMVAAYHLRRQGHHSTSDIIKSVGWWRLSQNPKQYERYILAALPNYKSSIRQ